MKIAVIANPFHPIPPEAIGAVEILWYDVSLQMAEWGHDVHVVGKGGVDVGDSARNFKATRVSGYKSNGRLPSDLVKTFLFDLQAFGKIDKSDILVVNNVWGPVITPFLAAWKYSRLVYSAQRVPKNFFKYFGNADGICCPSSPIAKMAACKLPQNYKGSIKTIPNPVDLNAFSPSRVMGHDWHDGVIIGYHGRIHPEKGIDILAAAVNELSGKYPGIRLRLVGTSDVARGGGGVEFDKSLDVLSGGRIERFEAESDRSKLARLLSPCDVYCYPSVAEHGETFGVSPLEAMALAKPVVVSDLSCFKDFLIDGDNGLIFDHRVSNPVKNLADKLDIFLSDCDFRRRVSFSAAESAKKFSIENVARMYVDWFEELLGSQR